MSGEKKCIRLQIDLPIDDAYLLEKISNDQISNMRFRLSLKALNEQNLSLNSYELSSLGSSSVSGYSSASDSLMLSVMSNELKVIDCLPNEIKHAVNNYDKLSFRKISNQSANYSRSNEIIKNRVENVYEEIIYDDKSSSNNQTNESKLYYNDSITTESSKSKICVKNLNKKYSLSQIMENLKNLNICAKEQEERILNENLDLTCSEPIYI